MSVDSFGSCGSGDDMSEIKLQLFPTHLEIYALWEATITLSYLDFVKPYVTKKKTEESTTRLIYLRFS